jgi:hypothetical protein
MEIKPASLLQVQNAQDGRMIVIDDDVLGVAQQLKEIDENLRLRYSEAGDFFVIYQESEDGVHQHLVLTSQDLNPQVVERVRQISSAAYDYVTELDRRDAEVDRARDHQFREQTGDVAERLSFAIRKDLGLTDRAFVGKGVSDGS